MKRNYPKTFQAVMLAALVTLAGANGCKSQQTAFTNPFLAPDRVPPPATRTLLPGQAAPYYPGDPLPSMQGATTSAAATQAIASKTPTSPAASRVTPAARESLAASNEPSVTIPSDGDALRFALPKPAPAPAPALTNPQPASQLAMASSPQLASPVSYSQPTAGSGFGQNATPPASTGPWRSPQIARQNTALPQPLNLGPPPTGQPLALGPTPNQFGPTTPPAAPQSTMAVSLRAVPSPAIEPVEASTPRIRLPGYPPPPPPVNVQPGAVQQAAYYSSNVAPPPGAVQGTGSLVQTVQITPLAANVYQPTVAAMSTSDGFRPRGSMR